MAATTHDASFYANDGSLLDLAFEGHDAQDDARMVEMSDPALFNQGVMEHAKYLGMDPTTDGLSCLTGIEYPLNCRSPIDPS